MKTEFLLYFGLFFLWTIVGVLAAARLAARVADRSRLIERVIEVVVFVVLLSIAPGLVFDLQGGAADYFTSVGAVVGIALCAATWPQLFGARAGRGWRDPLPAGVSVVVFIAAGVLIGAGLNSVKLYRDSVQLRQALSDLVAGTAPSPLMAGLRALAAVPVPERARAVVDIPRSRADYWGAGPCDYVPFVLPLATGLAHVDGRPTTACEIRTRALRLYPPRPAEVDETAPVCARRPDPSIRYVVTLPASGGFEWSVVDCHTTVR